MDLTVVIPTLNSMPAVRATLESLRRLKDRGAEIIVVDSHSTDGTIEVCRPFADRLLFFPKGNMYAAINEGMKTSRREWLTYINSDDLLFPSPMEKLVSSDPRDADLFYGNVDFIDSEGRFLHGFRMPSPADVLPLASLGINAIPPQGTFFRRKVFERLGGFDTHFRLAGDFDFFVRGKLAGFSFRRIPFPTVGAFRLHPTQYSQKLRDDHEREKHEIASRNGLSIGRFARFRAWLTFRWRNLGGYALRWFRSGQLGGRNRWRACMDME